MAIALESLFPEYVLNDDDKYGPSPISEEDEDDEEKRSKRVRSCHPQSETEKEKYLCAICLDFIDFDTQSVVKYCHQGHYLHGLCALTWVERTQHPLPCCVCLRCRRRICFLVFLSDF